MTIALNAPELSARAANAVAIVRSNIIFELDEACAGLRITEDEHKFACAAVLAAWSVDKNSDVFNAEVLEALRDTLALLVNGNGCDDDPDRIIAQARAVIAKAEGAT